MDLTVGQMAHVVHEANRALQRIVGDAVVSPTWWEAPLHQRDGLMHGVRRALAGATPEELHEEWVQWRTDRGWRYGLIKDDFAKTHPCLVPYDQLPAEQRVKDHLLLAIVTTLAAHLSPVESA
jgi:hypothetical protein